MDVVKRFEAHLVVLDQLRTVDEEHLVTSLGPIDAATKDRVTSVLGEMFAR